MAEKKQKSKEQQKRDLAKLAAAGAAAGYAAGKIAKGKKRGKKAKRRAAVVGFLMALIIVAVGAMYYFDIKPLDVDFLDGKFKSWYISPDDFVASDGNLQIRYLDIGQGDCILVQLPDGKTMLIDAGKNNNATETKILNTLDELGIDTIDYGILTHTDSDHIGGMDAVIESDAVTFKNVYMPLIKSSKYKPELVENWYAEAKTSYLSEISKNEPAGFEIGEITTQVYADVVKAIDEEGCNVFFSFEGMKITNATNEYVFDFYLPGYEQYDEDFNTAFEKNNVSPIMILKFNGKKIMFTGDCDDAESFFLSDVLAKGIDADVDVLKVAHHGGQDSTSPEFLSVVKPEYSVISVGENSYDHPRKAVIDRLNNVGSKIFTTQDKGDIILTIKGDKMGWAFEKDNSSYGSASEYEGEDLSVSYLPNFAYARSYAS